ncbi:MAG: hypothetical protein Q9160_005504 [Pyrenula sp. 1 TL-2023]
MAANEEETTPHFDIPKECWAGVVVDEGPNFHVEVQKVPVPEPDGHQASDQPPFTPPPYSPISISSPQTGPTDVLLKLNITGICHSDIHYMSNDWALPPMSHFGTRCAGHEGAGVIVKLGSSVTNLKVGMRAGFKPIADTCGACELCWGDMECYCEKKVLSGLHCDGSYKQYILSPARYTTLIPPSVPDALAAPIMCSASTIYTSLRTASLPAGSFAVFPGGGAGVGVQGVQLASAMGLRPIVVDVGQAKGVLARDMGAEAYVDFAAAGSAEMAAEEVVRACGGVGAHGVFVTAPQAYSSALSYLGSRAGGVVMCIGLPAAGTCRIEADPAAMVFRNWRVEGTLVSGMRDVAKTLEFAERGKLRLKPEVFKLGDIDEAVQKLKRGEIVGRAVVDFNL